MTLLFFTVVKAKTVVLLLSACLSPSHPVHD